MAAGQSGLVVFERFQKKRVAFVQKVADLAIKPANVDALQDGGVMRLLRPLLMDIVSARFLRPLRRVMAPLSAVA